MKTKIEDQIARYKDRKTRAEMKASYYLMIANDLDEKISKLLVKKDQP